MIHEMISGALLALAIWLGLSGIAFFVVGLAPGVSAPWYRQYAFAAAALTCSYYLFQLVFAVP